MKDEIIEEVWRIRDDISRRCNHDVRRIAAYAREHSRERGQESESATAQGKIVSKVALSVSEAKAKYGGEGPEECRGSTFDK